MKKLILSILSICFVLSLSAQKTKVEEKRENIGDGVNNALVVTIYSADLGNVEKEWKKKMKSSKAKVSGKKEIFADNAELPYISDNPIDVYARIEQKQGNVFMVVAYDLGGAYLNSSAHKTQYKAAEKMIYDFAVELSKLCIGEDLEDAEKVLKNKNKELERLQSENEGLHKDIERYEEQIAKAKKEVEDNVKDQENKVKEIEEQQKSVSGIEEQLKKVD
jgi:flagellar biosynthesis GTPase FlhF